MYYGPIECLLLYNLWVYQEANKMCQKWHNSHIRYYTHMAWNVKSENIQKSRSRDTCQYHLEHLTYSRVWTKNVSYFSVFFKEISSLYFCVPSSFLYIWGQNEQVCKILKLLCPHNLQFSQYINEISSKNT